MPIFKFSKMLTFVFLLLVVSLTAQDIAYSIPKKLSNKTPQFKILGKNNEGVIFYKYGNHTRQVEAYNGNLKLRWEQSVSLKFSDINMTRIVLYPAKTIMFYITNGKQVPTLYAEVLNSKFQSNGSILLLDSIDGGKYDITSMVRIAPSQNKSKILAYYPVFESNAMVGLKIICLQDNLTKVYSKIVRFSPIGVEEFKLRQVFPDNDGNVYILMENKDRLKKRGYAGKEFAVFKYDVVADNTFEINLELKKPVFKKMHLEVDNVNNRLVATGLYTDNSAEEAFGYFFSSIDLKTAKQVISTYSKFSKDLIFKVTGKDTEKFSSGFYSFEVDEVILRYDGGAIIIAESKYNAEENYQVPSFSPSVGPSYRTIKIFYYNDIVVIAINPDGSLGWSKVMKKKQVSEDDNGFFSSFSLITTKDRLRFIYNEEIFHKSNSNEYSLNHLGEMEREFLFNSGDKNIMLVPKFGKQISSTELLIPSYRRNYLSLVKLTYE